MNSKFGIVVLILLKKSSGQVKLQSRYISNLFKINGVRFDYFSVMFTEKSLEKLYRVNGVSGRVDDERIGRSRFINRSRGFRTLHNKRVPRDEEFTAVRADVFPRGHPEGRRCPLFRDFTGFGADGASGGGLTPKSVTFRLTSAETGLRETYYIMGTTWITNTTNSLNYYLPWRVRKARGVEGEGGIRLQIPRQS